MELSWLLAQQGFTVVNYDRRGRGKSGPIGPGSLERDSWAPEVMAGAPTSFLRPGR